ncbi:hypothetical protein N7530_010965 [Penicillium desertorum]|jgi:hypothetical protein|uniref:Uncharacterized protein n=1 Tax=Penicillium desertorum TaxID=1303715 RepID=A0A9X0BH67_9EURO|nr:hypothetical protein N7530_010965 [Penicillium desertorum]
MAGLQISAGSNWEYLFQNDSGNRLQTLLESFGSTEQFALADLLPKTFSVATSSESAGVENMIAWMR